MTKETVINLRVMNYEWLRHFLLTIRIQSILMNAQMVRRVLTPRSPTRLVAWQLLALPTFFVAAMSTDCHKLAE